MDVSDKWTRYFVNQANSPKDTSKIVNQQGRGFGQNRRGKKVYSQKGGVMQIGGKNPKVSPVMVSPVAQGFNMAQSKMQTTVGRKRGYKSGSNRSSSRSSSRPRKRIKRGPKSTGAKKKKSSVGGKRRKGGGKRKSRGKKSGGKKSGKIVKRKYNFDIFSKGKKRK